MGQRSQRAWRACWEIGAGGGSIARWLAEWVGPTGSVLATDIDPRFIPPSQLSHLQVLERAIGNRWDFATSLPQSLAGLGLADVSREGAWLRDEEVDLGEAVEPAARKPNSG